MLIKIIRLGMFAIDGKDKKGRPVLWSKPEFLKKSEGGQQKQRVKQLKIYNLEKMDKQYPNEGWNFCMDFSKITKNNVDIEYYLFLVKVYMVYYPRSVKNIFLINIPAIFEDTRKTIVEAMDQELKSRVKFPNYKELIDNHIDAKNLPSFVPRT